MKKENLILIVHILLQIILFIPIIPFIKYYQKIDAGILIIILVSALNFISYFITALNSEKKIIRKHSILVILFIVFTLIEDLILRDLLIIKHIELIIYSFLLLENMKLIYLLKNVSKQKATLGIIILMSALLLNYNKVISDFLLNFAILILLFIPCILYLANKKTRKYYGRLTLFIEICFLILFYIFKQFDDVGVISISEYLLLSAITLELVLLHKIVKTDIKNGIILFNDAIKKLVPEYIILFVIMYLAGMTLDSIILIYLYFFIFLIELRIYKKFRKYQILTFDEVLDNYYFEIYRNTEMERLNTLKIQTFLHDDILQIIIAIRRWIEDNLTGSGKSYILLNLDKLNDLIRHEIDSFNPKLKDYSSLYEAYNRLIKDLEDMYLNREIFIEFECDKNIELPSPYDELIYKCMNELLINAFKHSKGYNTNINLKVEKNVVYLTVTNVGDYIEDEDKIKEGNIGLNILRLKLKDFKGIFEYKVFKNNEELEESYVQFKIRVPLERSVVNESFVNRRS